MRLSLIVCFLFWLFGSVNGQPVVRYNTLSFNVNEGLLLSHVDDLAFDEMNIAWLSFANGLQRFDGQKFYPVQIQEGLPDDKNINFHETPGGSLLISHVAGISVYLPKTNSFRQIFTHDTPGESPSMFFGQDGSVIYFLAPSGNLVGIEENGYKKVYEFFLSNSKLLFEQHRLKYCHSNILNHRIAFFSDSSIIVLDIPSKKKLAVIPIQRHRNYFKIWLHGQSELVYQKDTDSASIIKFNYLTGKTTPVHIFYPWPSRSFRGGFFSWKTELFGYGDIQLFTMNPDDFSFNKQIRTTTDDWLVENTTIDAVKSDRLGNLYLITINNGIRKITRNKYPIRYYGITDKSPLMTVGLCIDKKANKIIVGLQGNGLMIFDTLQQLIKHIRNLPGKNNSFTPANILRLQNGSYLVFNSGEGHAWELSADLSNLVKRKFGNMPPNATIINDYYTNNFQDDSGHWWVVSNRHSEKISLSDGEIELSAFRKYDFSAATSFLGHLVFARGNEIIFSDPSTLEEKSSVVIENTGGVRCMVSDGLNKLYLGTNKGIFILDSNGNLLKHFSKSDGLLDECIYAMIIDEKEIIWASTNKGLFRIDKAGSLFFLDKYDGLQENEFNNNVAASSHDGEFFFGGVNGVSSFYPEQIMAYKDNIKLLVNRIKVNDKLLYNDTAYWSLDAIELPYNRNAISVDFVAMGHVQPAQYIYQYRMKGQNDEWIENGNSGNLRFFLSPGDYTLQLYASRSFDNKAIPMKEIRISILKPFWRTNFFFTLTGVIIFGIAALFFQQFVKRKYLARVMELELEKQKKDERERISRDLHDSLGAYVNAVLYNVELLESGTGDTLQKVVLKDLKFVSKDIINSLRETVWAFKKDTYSAEECFIRLRGFIQSCSRYFTQIHFKISGEVPTDRMLTYRHALDLVRIVQEAVTNAIRHADCNEISVHSFEKEGKWTLQVTDNGTGFDPGKIVPGNGMKHMKQRSFESSFDLKVLAEKDKGTTIELTV